MKKCASHSARAGESNASITGWIGPLLTQSLAILSIRAHCIGFFRKLLSHTYPGWDFRSTSSRRWKINRNSEKCGKMCIRLGAQGRPDWCRVPVLGDFLFFTSKHPTHSASTPLRVGWHQLDFAKMNKNRKKYGKMCITLGACRGGGCNLQQPN